MVEPYDRQLRLPVNNLAHRNYFIGAVTTHKPYLSQVFTTPVDGSNIATISVSIYFKENNSNNNESLLGTWNGQINVNRIFQQAVNDETANLLQLPKNKNTSSNNNEHIFLTIIAASLTVGIAAAATTANTLLPEGASAQSRTSPGGNATSGNSTSGNATK
jgi:hypothetical protein